MSTVSIDHIAMPTANAERLIEFYKRLDFHINDEEKWRSGEVPAFSIQVGNSKINIHPEGFVAGLRGPTAVPGCTDICFVWDGTVEECQAMLDAAGSGGYRRAGPAEGRAWRRRPSLAQSVRARPGPEPAGVDDLLLTMPLKERRLGRTRAWCSLSSAWARWTRRRRPKASTLSAPRSTWGIRLVDTARDYQGSEYLIGQVVRERGSDFCIASKTFSRTVNGSQADVDRSLAVLGVPSICLYQLHDVSTPSAWVQVMAPGGALEGLRTAQARELVQHVGISSHSLEIVEKAITCGEFDAVMLEYSAFYPESEDLIRLAARSGVGVIVMRPLGGSGRMSSLRSLNARGEDGADSRAAAALRAVQPRRLGGDTGRAIPGQGAPERRAVPGIRAAHRRRKA